MVMIHDYDAWLITYTYNTCLGRGKPLKVLSYLDAAAEEEAWLAAFVQLGKRGGSCLPVQAEAG